MKNTGNLRLPNSPFLCRLVFRHRYGQKLVDPSHQFEPCFRILIFAVLDNILKLQPEEVNFGFPKPCHDYSLLEPTMSRRNMEAHQDERNSWARPRKAPNHYLTIPKMTSDSKGDRSASGLYARSHEEMSGRWRLWVWEFIVARARGSKGDPTPPAIELSAGIF